MPAPAAAAIIPLIKGLLASSAKGVVAGAGRSALMTGVKAGAKGGLSQGIKSGVRQGARNTMRGGVMGDGRKDNRSDGLVKQTNDSAITRSENGGLAVQGRTIKEGGYTASAGPKSKKSLAIVKTGPAKDNILGLLEQIKKTADNIFEIEVKELDNDNKEYKDTKKEKEKERKLLEAEKRDEEEEDQEAKKAKKGKRKSNPVVKAAKNGIGNIFKFLIDLFKDFVVIKVLDWIANPKNKEKVHQLVKFIGMIPKIFSFLWDHFIGPWSKFAMSLFGGQFKILGAFFNVIKDLLTLKWLTNPGEFMNTLLEIPKTLLSIIPGILGSLLNAMTFGVIGKIGDLVSGLFNSPLKGIDFGNVGSLLGNAANFVKGLLGNAWGGISGFFGGLFGHGVEPDPPKKPEPETSQTPSPPAPSPPAPSPTTTTLGASGATSKQPTVGAKKAKTSIKSLDASQKKFDKMVGNQGTGETIKFKNVGSFVSGKNFFGQGEDKYFDPEGNPLQKEEFMATISSQRKRFTKLSGDTETVPVKTETDGSMSDLAGMQRSINDEERALAGARGGGGNPYGMEVTSTMGNRSLTLSPGLHMGIDISNGKSGAPLQAFTDATITGVGVDSGYGNWVAWTDTTGLENFYAHMKAPSPYKNGDKVKAGTKIGIVGDTGRGTGPHLHWEVSAKPGDTGMPKSSVRSRINPLTKYAHTAPFGGSTAPVEGSSTPPPPPKLPPPPGSTPPNLGSTSPRTGSNLGSAQQESRSLSSPSTQQKTPTVINNSSSTQSVSENSEGFSGSILPTSGLWSIYSYQL
jgi:murein DD-endopeptidase MepM/ murein hydrolase activator NlpD